MRLNLDGLLLSIQVDSSINQGCWIWHCRITIVPASLTVIQG